MPNNTHIERRQPRIVSKSNRARLTNKVAALLAGDGRLPLPRLYRDIITGIALDLGGADRLSTVKLALIRRFAGLVILAEHYESDLLQGKKVDLSVLSHIDLTLTRLASRIGLDRTAKTVPTLKDYIEGKARDITPRKRSRVSDFEDFEDDE